MFRRLFGLTLALATLMAAPAAAGSDRLKANLSGAEVQPAVMSEGTGRFTGRIDRKFEVINYTLTYRGLGGAVTEASLNIGRSGTNGGTAVLLCSNLGLSSEPLPACPAAPSSISGAIDWVNVRDLRGQGIGAGEMNQLLKAIEDESAYVLIHTGLFPSGEIRGQLKTRGGRRDRDDSDD